MRDQFGRFKKGNAPWNQGKELPVWVKNKISKSRKGQRNSPNTEFEKGHSAWLGKRRSEATKEKIRQAKLGKPLSEEHKRAIGLASSRRRPTEQTKEKIRIAQLGPKSHNWRGGISFEPYPICFNKGLKKKILKRDSYTCQLCKRKRSKKLPLLIHHIDYDKDNNIESNLVSLCRRCHGRTNYNRTYWIKLFQENIK